MELSNEQLEQGRRELERDPFDRILKHLPSRDEDTAEDPRSGRDQGCPRVQSPNQNMS